ncbi:MAG: hypothetical protein WBD67_06790, partial [Terracidiphilus sp.]
YLPVETPVYPLEDPPRAASSPLRMPEGRVAPDRRTRTAADDLLAEVQEEHPIMIQKLFTLAIAGALLFGAGAVAAQDNSAPNSAPAQAPGQASGQWGQRGRRMDPDQQLRRMTKQLDLTADQQSQIKPMLLDRQQKMQDLFQDQSLDRRTRRSRMQDIQRDTKSKIESVLTDAQKQKYEAMQQNMHRRGGYGRSGPPQAAPPQGEPQPQL